MTFKGLHSLLYLLMFCSVTNVAQHADCNTAYKFTNELGSINISGGSGNTLEIKGNNIKNEYLFTKEHNTAWTIVNFTFKGTFKFKLIPEIASDDFDFSVFTYSGASTCDSIIDGSLLPIRSNLARRNPDQGSITGLTDSVANFYSAAGKNPAFSKSIAVDSGMTLLVVFDSPYGNKGSFSIENNSEFIIPEKKEEKKEVVEELTPPVVTLEIIGKNGVRIDTPYVYAHTLHEEERDNPSYDSLGNFYSSSFRKSVKQRITISHPGYVLQEHSFSWTGQLDTTISIQIQPLQEGMVLKFENILFAANSSQILDKSRPELERLTTFLMKNPNLYVEIGGHIYSAKRRNKAKFKKLSRDRARMVYNHLIENGINEDNLSYKGYGNSKMIYKLPKTQKEFQANRRVEVKVVKIK